MIPHSNFPIYTFSKHEESYIPPTPATSFRQAFKSQTGRETEEEINLVIIYPITSNEKREKEESEISKPYIFSFSKN